MQPRPALIENHTLPGGVELEEKRLKEIRERLDAASPNPWFYSEYQSGSRNVSVYCVGMARHFSETRLALPPDDNGAMNWQLQGHDDQERANLIFIAHSREDIEALLDEVERLRRALGCNGKECVHWTSDGSGCKGFMGDCPYIKNRIAASE